MILAKRSFCAQLSLCSAPISIFCHSYGQDHVGWWEHAGGCLEGDPNGGYIAAAFKTAVFLADSSRPVTANSEDTDGSVVVCVGFHVTDRSVFVLGSVFRQTVVCLRQVLCL